MHSIAVRKEVSFDKGDVLMSEGEPGREALPHHRGHGRP